MIVGGNGMVTVSFEWLPVVIGVYGVVMGVYGWF